MIETCLVDETPEHHSRIMSNVAMVTGDGDSGGNAVDVTEIFQLLKMLEMKEGEGEKLAFYKRLKNWFDRTGKPVLRLHFGAAFPWLLYR